MAQPYLWLHLGCNEIVYFAHLGYTLPLSQSKVYEGSLLSAELFKRLFLLAYLNLVFIEFIYYIFEFNKIKSIPDDITNHLSQQIVIFLGASRPYQRNA